MSKTILVTGSSRGIGKAIALMLAEQGFDIVLHCRSNQALALEVKASIEALGRAVRVLQFDVADRAAVRSAIEGDIEANGAYYGVVCNAGISKDNAFPAMTDDEWDSVIHTNLDGFYNVVQPTIMPMIRAKKGGRIVTLSSVSGIMGNRGQVNYSATKAGIIGATKALAIELAKRKITVNCVAPGLIETDMVSDEVLKHAKEMIPLKRMGKPEEVASAVAYICSDGASYMTRQVLSINGGMC